MFISRCAPQPCLALSLSWHFRSCFQLQEYTMLPPHVFPSTGFSTILSLLVGNRKHSAFKPEIRKLALISLSVLSSLSLPSLSFSLSFPSHSLPISLSPPTPLWLPPSYTTSNSHTHIQLISPAEDKAHSVNVKHHKRLTTEKQPL